MASERELLIALTVLEQGLLDFLPLTLASKGARCLGAMSGTW